MGKTDIKILVIDRLLKKDEHSSWFLLKYGQEFTLIFFPKRKDLVSLNFNKIIFSNKEYDLLKTLIELFSEKKGEEGHAFKKNPPYYFIEIDSIEEEEVYNILKKYFNLEIKKITELEKSS